MIFAYLSKCRLAFKSSFIQSNEEPARALIVRKVKVLQYSGHRNEFSLSTYTSWSVRITAKETLTFLFNHMFILSWKLEMKVI